jgi:hypothetical protein
LILPGQPVTLIKVSLKNEQHTYYKVLPEEMPDYDCGSFVLSLPILNLRQVLNLAKYFDFTRNQAEMQNEEQQLIIHHRKENGVIP